MHAKAAPAQPSLKSAMPQRSAEDAPARASDSGQLSASPRSGTREGSTAEAPAVVIPRKRTSDDESADDAQGVPKGQTSETTAVGADALTHLHNGHADGAKGGSKRTISPPPAASNEVKRQRISDRHDATIRPRCTTRTAGSNMEATTRSPAESPVGVEVTGTTTAADEATRRSSRAPDNRQTSGRCSPEAPGSAEPQQRKIVGTRHPVRNESVEDDARGGNIEATV